MAVANERFSGLPERLVLECDYAADPLWATTSDGETLMVELDPLPLSDDLKADLRAWARTFQEITWPPDADRRPDSEQWQDFVARGDGLARRLQEELGSAVEVVYGHAPA
jgi:hypothetical protein